MSPRVSKNVTVDAGKTESVTLSFTAEAADQGTHDNATVTVTNTGSGTQDSRDITIPTVIAHDEFMIGTDSSEDTVTFAPAGPVDATTDSITIETMGTSELRDRLAPLDSSGDVEFVETAFGAFRHVDRSGGDAVIFRPPDALRPPLSTRRVLPVDVDTEQLAPDLFNIELELGLSRPRARDPTDVEPDDPEVVDSATVRLDPDETESVTLSFDSDGRTPGDETVTVQGPRSQDNDSAVVTFTDTDWTFAFEAATLSLSSQQVGLIDRESDEGIPRLSVDVFLSRSQVRQLFAAGSRVGAVRRREIADAANRVRDTLPSEDATANVQVPEEAAVDSGTWALTDWTVEWVGTVGRFPWRGEIEFYVID